MKTVRSCTFIAAALAAAACVVTPAPKPSTPSSPAAPTLRAASIFVYDAMGRPVAGAHCALDGTSTAADPANADGYVLFASVPASLRATQITCAADGFVPFSEHRDLATSADEWIVPNVTMTSTHVDPFSRPLADVLKFRSGLFSTYAGACDLPYGIRPHQPTNIIFFGANYYSREQIDCTNAVWTSLGYTHGIMGPFIAQGYHGQTPDTDVTTSPEAAAAAIANIRYQIDAGFDVVLVLVPDHCGAEGIPGVCGPWADHIWTVNELRGSKLEAFYKSPEFQAVADEIMLCWECQGDKYGWSNRTYVEYFRWVMSVVPRARVRALHVISDIEAPVGQGDETKTDNCHGKTRGLDCITNGEAWSNVANAGMNVFFHQSNAVITAAHIADNGKTDGENWLELWDRTNPASFVRRFSDPTVYSDWPKDVLPIPAEYLSIEVYNGRRTMDEARDWGARAMAAGAAGYMDGGR